VASYKGKKGTGIQLKKIRTVKIEQKEREIRYYDCFNP